ncbi:ATP-binding protein [Streptomyces albidochromogenes]|uniref:ATP-binding protein n=1 Tax=Streptomyces albidochromogenes TaxID=329524 RepID=A0ABW6FLR3_9ACTN
MNDDQDHAGPQARCSEGDLPEERPVGTVALRPASPREETPREVSDGSVPAAEDALPAGRGAWAGVAYDGTSAAIGDARRFVAKFLAQVRAERRPEISAQVTGVAELVVSELVTNACKYAPGPCVVNVELAGPVVEITVWDSDPVLPQARAAEPSRVGGHGLEIVSALCEGFEAQREPIGKQVKARVPVAPADDQGRRADAPRRAPAAGGH